MSRLGLTSALLLLLLVLWAGCASDPSSLDQTMQSSAAPSSVRVSESMSRLAILYSQTENQELRTAYSRLEGGMFVVKGQRPNLRIVDRSELETVLGEQRFQMSGAVSDNSAISTGRLLGVDAVLLFRVDGPTWREKMLARFSGNLPPIAVRSKLIHVESGEVLFYSVVTVPIEEWPSEKRSSPGTADMEPAIRTALNKAVSDTIVALQHAFR